MKHHLQRNLGVLLIGIGLLLVTFGIYGLTQPDEFRASARIIIVPEDTAGLFFRHECEFEARDEALKSDNLLSNVVWMLNLDSEQTNLTDTTQAGKMSKAIVALRKGLEIRQIPNTQLFEITLTERTPTQAAKCANAIVMAYKVEVFNKQRALVQEGIRELKHQLELQQQKVSKLETQLSQLRETLKPPSPEPAEAELEVNYPAYRHAKNNFKDEKDVMGLLARKISIEETDLQSPRGFPQIEIIETAVPPTSPVRRKKSLGTILLVAGLGCCLWGRTVTRDAKLTANPV